MKTDAKFNPFFDVERCPIQTVIGGQKITLSKYALVNSETKKVVGIVSKDFKVIRNEDVNNAFGELYSNFKIKQIMDFVKRGGETWVRRIVLEDDQFTFEVSPGDFQHIMIEIYNSFNTSTRVGMNLSLFRSICSNGMVFGRKNLFGMNFTHMRNQLDVIRSSFQIGAKAIGDEIIPIWKKWTKIPHTMNDMEVFLDSRDYVKNDKMKERILLKYEEVMNREKHDETRFGAFNAITEILTHHTTSRREDTSNIFGSAYKKYEKLAMDMYSLPM